MQRLRHLVDIWVFLSWSVNTLYVTRWRKHLISDFSAAVDFTSRFQDGICAWLSSTHSMHSCTTKPSSWAVLLVVPYSFYAFSIVLYVFCWQGGCLPLQKAATKLVWVAYNVWFLVYACTPSHKHAVLGHTKMGSIVLFSSQGFWHFDTNVSGWPWCGWVNQNAHGI